MRAAIFAALALATLAGRAQSQVLASDDFSYVGALTSNGWIAHSGAGNKIIMSDGNVATLDQSTGSGEDVNLTFTAQGAADKTYAGFDINVPSGNPVSPDGQGLYAVHLKNSATNYRARTGVLSPAGGGDYLLAINADNGNLGLGAAWASDQSFDTTYRVVISWDAGTGASEMWVDPVDELSTKVSHTGGFTADLIEGLALRQSNDYTGFIKIDNVVAGKTFADVLGGGGLNTGSPGCDGSAGNCPCFTVGAVDHGCPNSNPDLLGAYLIGAGHASVLNDSFSLSVTSAGISKPGLVLSGTADLSPGISTIADSAGLLCVGGITKRGAVFFTDGAGSVNLPDFQGAPYGMASNVQVGMLNTYTFWYRDPGTACLPNDTGASDFNFSNVWSVSWMP
jgi:hypothetical protein